MLKLPSRYFLRSSSSRAPWKSTGPGKGASAPYSSTATARSKGSAWKRPSLFFQIGFLALAVSAYLSLGEEKASDPQIEPLLARQWKWADPPACPGLKKGFYELESEGESKDFYIDESGRALAFHAESWPEPPYQCRSIDKPSFVEEI